MKMNLLPETQTSDLLDLCGSRASLQGSTRSLYVMWCIGKPVLDLCGHLGKQAEKSAAEEPVVSTCASEKR